MSDRVSPFAALTGAEKQIKWLEYQSVRLPYIQASMEQTPDAISEVKPQQAKEEHDLSTISQEVSSNSRPLQRPTPPPEVFVSPQAARNDFQKTRHSQYDAVIARMKQAELKARSYHTMS